MTKSVEARPPRRKRRTTQEVLDSIISAASAEFELNGYAGATTAAIARRAGVAEGLIFTNFGSKANIFHKSIFDPLNEQLVDFCTHHLAEGSFIPKDEFDLKRREYIGELQAFVKQNSRKLTSLLVTYLYDEEVPDLRSAEGLDGYFDKAARFAQGQIADPPVIDPGLMPRISFATILSCILFKDWLFPSSMVSDQALDQAVISQVIDGLRINDPDPAVGS